MAEGRSVAVVTPLVTRAAAVRALGAQPEVIFHLDMAPLGRLLISRSDHMWRMQALYGNAQRNGSADRGVDRRSTEDHIRQHGRRPGDTGAIPQDGRGYH
jgi:hypothetical protein